MLRLISSALAALLCAGSVAMAAAPAQAADSCGITISPRVVIDAPYEKIPVTYGGDCVANEAAAAWAAVHSYEGPTDFVIYDYAAGDDRADFFEHYDWEPLGSYSVDPGGAYSNTDDRELYQNAPTTTMKLGTRVALAVTRSGGRAYFTTTTSAYSPASDAFRRYPNAKVAVQFKSCVSCVWSTLRLGYTNSSAAWSFNIASTKKFYFRGVLYSGPKAWDAQGSTLFR